MVLASLLTLTLVSVVSATAAGLFTPTKPTPGSETVVSGCVLRFTSATNGMPAIHANSSHACPGVTAVYLSTTGNITVRQNVDADRYIIVSTMAQADESLALRGIQAGASGGTGRTTFYLYDSVNKRRLNLTKATDRKRITCDTCNLWLSWTHQRKVFSTTAATRTPTVTTTLTRTSTVTVTRSPAATPQAPAATSQAPAPTPQPPAAPAEKASSPASTSAPGSPAPTTTSTP